MNTKQRIESEIQTQVLMNLAMDLFKQSATVYWPQQTHYIMSMREKKILIFFNCAKTKFLSAMKPVQYV